MRNPSLITVTGLQRHAVPHAQSERLDWDGTPHSLDSSLASPIPRQHNTLSQLIVPDVPINIITFNIV